MTSAKDLLHEASIPITDTPKQIGTKESLKVNIAGWVPILTQAIREQQDLIEELKIQLEAQNKLILNISQKIK